MTIQDRLDQAVQLLKNKLIVEAPFDTGNLALNAIRLIQDNGAWHIVIGGEVAPYAPYTNEKWERGQNPNEGWIQRTIENAKPTLIKVLSGRITQEEYERELNKQRLIIDAKKIRRSEELKLKEAKILERINKIGGVR